MKTTKIETVADITIEIGTIIPSHPDDYPIEYKINILKGSILQERKSCYYITTKNSDGNFLSTPYDPSVFDFICSKAISQGSVKVESEDNLKTFKMFRLITKNRIIPEEGNYITQFEAESIEDAERQAKQFAVKYNWEKEKYCVR
jgi:hypothetical protein